jgi:hypothetical protein
MAVLLHVEATIPNRLEYCRTLREKKSPDASGDIARNDFQEEVLTHAIALSSNISAETLAKRDHPVLISGPAPGP